MLLLGVSPVEIGQQLGIPERTVYLWRSQLSPAKYAEVCSKKEHFDELLETYLAVALRSLVSLAQVTGEREYILEQPADSLYLLHGTMADKVVLRLYARHRAGELAAAGDAEAGAVNSDA